MKYPELTKTLEEYGLKERHAKIYLALLSLGTAGIQKIAQKSGFARSTCEAVLIQLQQKGFASSFRKKKVKTYSAEDPHTIVSIAEQKTELLRNSLPKFLDLYRSHDSIPSMRHYEGKAGMKIVLKEILDEAKELICLGSADNMFETMVGYIQDFIKERIKRKIHLRLILQESPFAHERKRAQEQNLMQVKVIPADHKFTSIMYIWNNKIAMFSLQKDITALVIENEELARLQKAMFENIWNTIA